MYEDLCLYIDGEFVKGGGRREQDVFDPATGNVIGRLPHATRVISIARWPRRNGRSKSGEPSRRWRRAASCARWAS